MLEFRLPPRSIVAFVEKLSSINELEADHMAMLRSMEVYAHVKIEDIDPSVASHLEDAEAHTAQAQAQVQAPDAADHNGHNDASTHGQDTQR